jgi:hypothetical protein
MVSVASQPQVRQARLVRSSPSATSTVRTRMRVWQVGQIQGGAGEGGSSCRGRGMRLPCTVAGKNVPPFPNGDELFIFASPRNLLAPFRIDPDTSDIQKTGGRPAEARPPTEAA